ncbi:putative O-methyltransferase [Mycena sanguinolenta]|uniref:Putative O-methyltransferase n=1 Tax=Mycena sanguinolenta TaxID=230812 RepID=A0A8H6Z646_9AGAR|nr:putative O-methyltransferase [Mycena sanguinolenta]
MIPPALQPEEIIAELQAVGSAYAEKKPGAREQLLNLSHALIASLELPSETIQRMAFAEPARAAHCRIAVELKLFEYLKESGPDGISSQDLAAKADAHEVLISRMMKHLAAMNTIHEKSPDIYVSSPFSEALTEPKHRDGIIYTYDVAGPPLRGLPEYLKSIKYDLPTDLTDGPFQAAHKTQLPFFAWIDQNPPYLQLFNSYMSGYRAGKPSWVDPDFYPVADRLAKPFDPSISEVLLVDIGGGLGHDLVELKAKHPTLPGKLVLQDRPEPVRGARAYYLHSVLHDWSDDDCVKILEQLKPAMEPGYSKLLISEIVVPRQNATWPVTVVDQVMLILVAMQERTESQWENILKRAGFRIQKIYRYEVGTESLIEAEME